MASNFYEFGVYAHKGRMYCVDIGSVISDPRDGDMCIAISENKARVIEQMEQFVAEAQAALERVKNLPDDPADWSLLAAGAGLYDPKDS